MPLRGPEHLIQPVGRYTPKGWKHLTYNANGELTSKTNRDTSAAQTYAYSTLGALQSVTTAGGNEIAYKYDAQGNRVEARTDGEATQRLIYAPGPLGPVAELATAGRAETRFVYASRVNVPDYMVRGGRTYRLVTDQLGSVRFVVDSTTGEIAQEIAYDPFGEVISDSEPGFQPFGFAGGLYNSSTGLTHFGAREYDAGLGRWTSRDPISFAGGDANLYGYVIEDPVNSTDPAGLYAVNLPGQNLNRRVTELAGAVEDFVGGIGSRDHATRYVGFVDGVTGGLTRKVREGLPYLGDGLNECSGEYRIGHGIGRATLYVEAAAVSYGAGSAGAKSIEWLGKFPKGSPSVPTRVMNELLQRHPDLFEKLDKFYKIYANTFGKLKGHP